MTPPISIDGTDITGATIDGTDVQEITVDGDTVFSAGPPPIPDSGVSRWTFDDVDTNGGAIDIWGGYDGTINGATTGVSGANQTYTTNEAYSFDGSNDFVEVNDTDNNFDFPEKSIAFWISVDDVSASDGDQVLEHSSNQLSAGLSFADIISGDFRATINRSDAKTVISNMSDNTWYHVVLTADNGNDESVFYLDGSQVATSNTGTGGSSASANENIVWAANRIGSENLACDIDDARLYSKQLSATEVSNLYNTGSIDV